MFMRAAAHANLPLARLKSNSNSSCYNCLHWSQIKKYRRVTYQISEMDRVHRQTSHMPAELPIAKNQAAYLPTLT